MKLALPIPDQSVKEKYTAASDGPITTQTYSRRTGRMNSQGVVDFQNRLRVALALSKGYAWVIALITTPVYSSEWIIV
jgi:hypothetical protein